MSRTCGSKAAGFYLYRAIDSAGATIDFLLSAVRSADAAKQLFSQALVDPSHSQPLVGSSLQKPRDKIFAMKQEAEG